MMAVLRAGLSFFVIMFALNATGWAQKKGDEGIMNKLLAPGPLIEGHLNLEHKDCLQCHEANAGVPDRRCLSCHKEIKKFVSARKGFHGRTTKPCMTCHSDHKGRGFDSTQVNEKTFDHSSTGFILTGAHRNIPCRECHTAKRQGKKLRPFDIRFLRESAGNCRSCHAKDDVHFFTGRFKQKDCNSCHNDRSWKEMSAFDHKKETGFALIGKHASLSCAKCHTPRGKASARYDWPIATKQCLSCHDDFHKEKLSPRFRGGKCETCHSQSSWQINNFNHAVTGFPLRGQHASVSCISCHKQSSVTSSGQRSVNWIGLKRECVSCHADYHGFGGQKSRSKKRPLTQCLDCHGEQSWKQELRFNHNSDTPFDIDGKHTELRCFECHVPAKKAAVKGTTLRFYHWPNLAQKSCETCHSNPHPPEFRKRFKNLRCESCHETGGWHLTSKMNKFFNHDKTTRFPLTGKHERTPCDSCHKVAGKNVYKFAGAEKKFCVTCHSNIHGKQFSAKFTQAPCIQCHNTEAFNQLAAFNHDQTRFKIEGAHSKFAQDCVQCHVKTNAMLATKPPKPAGKFIFEGQKTGFCESCHQNVHAKQFTPKFAERSCISCHSTKAFMPLQQFNHNETRFKLTGEHAKISQRCELCHVKTQNMLATKPPKPAGKFIFEGEKNGFCEACHSNVHERQFSAKFAQKPCKECHETDHFMPLKPFDHNQTDFKLTGKHAEIAKKCSECHIKTEQLLPIKPPKPAGKFIFSFSDRNYCEACHNNIHERQFSEKFASAPCSECHSTKAFWPLTKFDHDKTRFRLIEAHAKIESECKKCHVETKQLLATKPPRPAGKFKFESVEQGFCVACHANEHKKQFRPRFAERPCIECHTQDRFTERKKFNHAKTLFALKGKHQTVKCSACHTKTKAHFKAPPQNAKGRFLFSKAQRDSCLTCHTDPHKGEFGKNCASCHTEKGWQLTGDFHKGFLLSGTHYKLPCTECHENQRKLEGQSENCQLCHLKDDPHLGSLRECKDCHRQDIWNITQWQHAFTQFPLRGSHRVLSCTECHGAGVYRGLPTACMSCHFKDAAAVTVPDHSGAGFQTCGDCHNEFSF